jgi:hypothetical protein
MQKSRPYTNATFTKRVDHEAGSHRGPRAPKGPAVCTSCQNVYRERRWLLASDQRAVLAREVLDARSVVCPACRMVAEGQWRGEVRLEGPFLFAHRDEVERLLTNEAARASEDNPLARIIHREWTAKRFTLTTTTEHLAKRLGQALEKAFDGAVHYGFGHENKTACVTWARQ